MIDHQLVFLRSENARISLKNLSQKLAKSPQRLKHSLSVLERKAILFRPYCLFDYSYFGLLLFRAYFKGGYISEENKRQILEELVHNPSVLAIYELTGEFDLVVEFASPNPSKFNKEFKKITASIPVLGDYKIVLNVVTHLYPRHYLSFMPEIQNPQAEKIVGGDRERETFSSKEMAVMKNLLLHPLTRFTTLAMRSGINVKTAKSILKNLTKRNIIKGFKYLVDLDQLGITKNRLFLKLHHVRLEREAELLQFILSTKEIVQLNKTVGDWDMEVDIETFDKNQIRGIIMQIREKFKDIIEKINLIDFYRYHHRAYLPRILFESELSAKTK